MSARTASRCAAEMAPRANIWWGGVLVVGEQHDLGMGLEVGGGSEALHDVQQHHLDLVGNLLEHPAKHRGVGLDGVTQQHQLAGGIATGEVDDVLDLLVLDAFMDPKARQHECKGVAVADRADVDTGLAQGVAGAHDDAVAGGDEVDVAQGVGAVDAGVEGGEEGAGAGVDGAAGVGVFGWFDGVVDVRDHDAAGRRHVGPGLVDQAQGSLTQAGVVDVVEDEVVDVMVGVSAVDEAQALAPVHGRQGRQRVDDLLLPAWPGGAPGQVKDALLGVAGRQSGDGRHEALSAVEARSAISPLTDGGGNRRGRGWESVGKALGKRWESVGKALGNGGDQVCRRADVGVDRGPATCAP